MRSSPIEFEWETPKGLSEALKCVAMGAIPFAGGTDLMVLFEAGRLPKGKYVDLTQIPSLSEIRWDSDSVHIGALTTYSAILGSGRLVRLFPDLAEAARVTGAKAIQNRGTLGGNIANASPAADSPPVLLTRGARLHLSSIHAERVLEYGEFHRAYKKTLLRSDEIIHHIELPRPKPKTRWYYRKIGTRNAQAISKVVMSGAVRLEKKMLHDIRVAVGSLAPYPKRLGAVERLLEGQKLCSSIIDEAVRTISRDVTPIDDIRSTAIYRTRVAENCLREFLEALS